MVDDKTCQVFRGSAVDTWATDQHNFRLNDDQCTEKPYMHVTELSEDDSVIPVCKVHGESWLGNEPRARVVDILVATPEEVAAAIASIQGGAPTS